MTKSSKLFFIVLISVAVLTFFISIQFSLAKDGNLKIYFFDVGQGDSIFIKTPEGRDILIDGGPNSTVLQRLGEALPFWDRTIDMAVLTHPHADHIDGLNDVLKRYKVDTVLESDLVNEPESMQYFNSLISKGFEVESAVVLPVSTSGENSTGTDIRTGGTPAGRMSVQKGDHFNLEQDLTLDILYPLSLQIDEKDLNDDSIVMRLTYKGKKFLFTGDATTNVEEKLMEDDLKSDFLKVGHHGSRYSSSEKFLNAVKPAISIISVGEGNSFGHPTQDTLDRLSAVGSRTLRTDKSGTVEVEMENTGEWEIRCSKACS